MFVYSKQSPTHTHVRTWRWAEKDVRWDGGVRKGVAEVGPEANTVALVDLEEAMVVEAWVPKLSRRGSRLRCNPRAAPGIARP